MATAITVHKLDEGTNSDEISHEYLGERTEDDAEMAGELVANSISDKGWITALSVAVFDQKADDVADQCEDNLPLNEFQSDLDAYFSALIPQSRPLQHGASSKSAKSFGISMSSKKSRRAAPTLEKDGLRALLPLPWRFASRPEHKGQGFTSRTHKYLPFPVARYLEGNMPHVFQKAYEPNKVDVGSVLPPLAGFSPLPRSEEWIAVFLRTRPMWVIPVDGILPWADASSGEMRLDETCVDYNILHPVEDQHDKIVWNPELLRGFWDFLLTHRDKGTVGPLSFAYAVAGWYKKEGLDLPDCIMVRCNAEVALRVRSLLSTYYIEYTPTEVHPDDGCDDCKRSIGATAKGRLLDLRNVVAPLRRPRLVLLAEDHTPLLMA